MSQILSLIYEVIDEINGQLPADQQLAKTPETVIVGQDSVLDSLGVINFLVALEEKVTASTGQFVSLMNETTLSDQPSPVRTVALIEQYLSESF